MNRLSVVMTVASLLLLGAQAPVSATEREAQPSPKKSVIVRDARNDVVVDGRVGKRAPIDIHNVRYSTGWERGYRVVRVLIKVKNASGRAQQPFTEFKTSRGAKERRTITVVYNDAGQIDVFSTRAFPDGAGGIDPKIQRTWWDREDNVIGMVISTERFGGATSFRGNTTTLSYTGSGAPYPRDYTRFSAPIRR